MLASAFDHAIRPAHAYQAELRRVLRPQARSASRAPRGTGRRTHRRRGGGRPTPNDLRAQARRRRRVSSLLCRELQRRDAQRRGIVRARSSRAGPSSPPTLGELGSCDGSVVRRATVALVSAGCGRQFALRWLRARLRQAACAA
eukprot:4953735-Pleurochrysis_carterae.AAC.1